jgi:transcriptional regulator with XRE-family HTH domain
VKRFTGYADEIKAFGGILQKIRKEKGITVQELALEADIDRRTIQRIEKGNAVITLHTMLAIAAALKIDPREFFSFIDKTKH